MVKRRGRRHSKKCPCNENILTQTRYFGKSTNALVNRTGANQTRFIRKADPCFVRYLSRCAEGILTGDVKLRKKSAYKQLDKDFLTKLANPSFSIKHKRKLLQHQQRGQYGGFLGIIAEIAAAALASLIGSRLARRSS